MYTYKPKKDFEEMQELIDASPDADLHSINEWFTLGQKSRVDVHTLMSHLDRWRKEETRSQDIRSAIGILLTQMTPEREFEAATAVLERKFQENINITNAELQTWLQAGQRSMRTPGALVDDVREWLNSLKLSAHNQELLIHVLHDYDDTRAAPNRSRVLQAMEVHNISPITGTAATVFKGGEWSPADQEVQDRRSGNPRKRRIAGRDESAVA